MTALRPMMPRLGQPLYGAGFGDAFIRFWKRGLDFRGRSSRSEYWWMHLLGACLSPVAFGVGYAVGYSRDAIAALLLLPFVLVPLLAVAVPGTSVSVRRLHDANFSGWWMLLSFVPLGSFVLLGLLATESNPLGARFDRPTGYSPGPVAVPSAPARSAQHPSIGQPAAPRPAAGSAADGDAKTRWVVGALGVLLLLGVLAFAFSLVP